MSRFRRLLLRAAFLHAIGSSWATPAPACPFCGTVGEPLARRRDSAVLTCIAEADGPARRDAAGLLEAPFRILQALPTGEGPGRDPPSHVVARVPA